MVTEVPTGPAGGINPVMVGGPMTVKLTGPLVPAAVVTVTLAAPVDASAPIVKVARICVGLVTLTFVTVTPGFPTATVAPATKFVPVSDTPTLVPCVPDDGLTAVRVGKATTVVGSSARSLVAFVSPPPETSARLVTLESASAATFTVRVIGG